MSRFHDDAVVDVYYAETGEVTRVAFNGLDAFEQARQYATRSGELVCVGTIVTADAMGLGNDYKAFVPEELEKLAVSRLAEFRGLIPPETIKIFVVKVSAEVPLEPEPKPLRDLEDERMAEFEAMDGPRTAGDLGGEELDDHDRS